MGKKIDCYVAGNLKKYVSLSQFVSFFFNVTDIILIFTDNWTFQNWHCCYVYLLAFKELCTYCMQSALIFIENLLLVWELGVCRLENMNFIDSPKLFRSLKKFHIREIFRWTSSSRNLWKNDCPKNHEPIRQTEGKKIKTKVS